jgi:hypothetical protein
MSNKLKIRKMKKVIITLTLLLISQIVFAQTTDNLRQALSKVEGTEVVDFPSLIVKMMNKGMKGKTKIEKQTIIAAETNQAEFVKTLNVELQKLLNNGFKLKEQPMPEGDTMLSYTLGDDKFAYEIVYRLVGKNASSMIIILKGKIDYAHLKGDLSKRPTIDANFLKRAEEMVSKMF